MNPSEPLRRLLENLGRNYARREVEVEFDEQPRITTDGETIYVWSNPAEVLELDIGPANEFRLIRNALNHECAHDRFSELDAKASFAARYDRHSKLAASMLNRLEDSYIDSRRLAENPGLRAAQAFFVESQLPGGDGFEADPVDELDTSEALVRVLDYYALAGRVPGISNADDEVRQFAAWAKPQVEAFRDTDDPEGRESIAVRIVDGLIEALPNTPDDDLLDDLADEIAANASGELPDEATVENMPDMNIPDDANAPDDLPELDDLDIDVSELDADAGDEGEAAEADAGAEADGSGDDEASDADGDGESTDESGETNDGSTGGGDGEFDPESELDELDEADGDDGTYHGDDVGDDYDEANESDERRYERVADEARLENETPLGERKAERDERVRDGSGVASNDISSGQVREYLRASGLAKDVRRAFEQFANLDITTTSDTGDRVNVENAVRHMAGDYSTTDVYETDYTSDPGGRLIGVSLDLSYSMRSDGSDDIENELGERVGAIADAKAALGAVNVAAHELGDDLVASGFHRPRGVKTPLITGPNESFEWEHLDAATYIHGTGTDTPTAHGILDTLDLIEQGGGRERLMLVITDGIPKDRGPNHRGDNAETDARVAVEQARTQGVGVIGIGVGSGVNERAMSTMFGDDGYVLTESDTLVDDLVSLYADELDYERPAGY